MTAVFLGAIALVVGWGAFAFGAVYPWTYWPLCGAAVVTGAAGLALGSPRDGVSRALALFFVLLLAALGLQLVPLPSSLLSRISPAAVDALRQLDPVFASGATSEHALSLNPASTRTALMLLASFGFFAAGTAAAFARFGAERMVSIVIAIGAALSLTGIIQNATYEGKMYGFWTPLEGTNPFGPFVNRNHFAGWLLMCLPVALGCFCMELARSMRDTRPELRERLLWFSSPRANKLILVGFAAVMMALGLAMTLSRSGIGAMALAILMTGWWFARGTSSAAKKAVGVLYLAALVVLVFVWTGADIIGQRFADTDWSGLNQRLAPWTDAASLFVRFPATGSGINTYSDAMLLYQTQDLARHYGAAHNDYLQLLAEGGLLVALPVMAVVASLVVTVRRRLREDRDSSYYWLRAGAALAIVAIGIQETVEFSLQMPGNAVLFALVCAIAIHRRPPRRQGSAALPYPASA